MKTMYIPMFTALALLAFAANSVLCRLALGGQLIDAASFTMIRLLSGAVMLYVLLSFMSYLAPRKKSRKSKGSWLASLMLFIYAATFSFAYLSLDTGTGALILFGSIQMTLVGISLWQGKRLNFLEAVGLLLACIGFVYLMLPSSTTPPWQGVVLMFVSGVAWSIYTLKGFRSLSSLSDTTYNFIRTAPFVMLLFFNTLDATYLTQEGVVLAIVSGALASGLGYTLWYMALQGLTSVKAAVLQLLVPLIAVVGGVFIVDETMTLRFVIAMSLILSGVFLVVIYGKKIAGT